MAAAVESPNGHMSPESPTEEADAIYPCKGCGEILEEGKAFELGGSRWHIDCFRCNTCGTLLDSDANLLLLGDGSLICNNCTYSCNACGNKIEDLAILTGDQAFCAACFKCRNCKRKIDNLRYARTSQGIFCMRCHETLMERRRKKAKAAKAAAAANPAVLDKSLPALPPSLQPLATFDLKDPPADDSLTTSSTSKYNSGADMASLAPSPMVDENQKAARKSTTGASRRRTMSTDNLLLPASTYGQENPSVSFFAPSSPDEDDDDESRGYLPMAFDPTPPPLVSRSPRRASRDASATRDAANGQKDYFNARSNSKTSASDYLTPSRSDSSEREPGKRSASPQSSLRHELHRKEAPEIKSDQTSKPASPLRPPLNHSSSSSYSNFKLQEAPAPKPRKTSFKSEESDAKSPELADGIDNDLGPNPFDDPKLSDLSGRHPVRGDSLTAPGRKPVPTSATRTDSDSIKSTTLVVASDRQQSVSAASDKSSLVETPGIPPRGDSRLDVPLGITGLSTNLPQRSTGRVSAPSKSVANDDFIAPRHAPPAPPSDRRENSIGSGNDSDVPGSIPSHFRKPSLGADFSLDEEMSRIIGGKSISPRASSPSTPSIMRRVSNAVRHGRSFSDKSATIAPRTPRLGSSIDISSPMSPGHPRSPDMRGDDTASLKAHLKRAQQRIAELEGEKTALEERMANSGDLKHVNTELREKRSTVAYLDTQREMVVRELEVMTEHLSRAKDTNQLLDLPSLKSDILQDFAHSLNRLKDSLSNQVEDLIHRRNELTDEIANLIQVKDKGLQEFESLSHKNTQLTTLNAQLVSSIQEVYKANRIPNGPSMSDLRSNSIGQDTASLTSFPQDSPDLEQAQLLTAPQVVNIRKGGQAKKFSWKKGGRDVAKKMTGGIKGAFVKDGQYDLNGVPIGQPYPVLSGMGDEKGMYEGQGDSAGKGRLLDFRQKFGGMQKSSSSHNLLGTPDSNIARRSMNLTPTFLNASSSLFGSDLSQRCDHERRMLPNIVTRCIEEVEARGMDVEGIYRKSGGSGQVKSIQAGFERCERDDTFDISDPDLDIHAVTSCLKQYFRKLPDPLITFDVYDSVLEAAGLPEEKRGMAMKIALGNLPPCHKDVLEYLIVHLTRVVEQESLNLMTPLNLSVVFAPTIMRSTSIEREMTDMQAQRDVVRGLLEHHTTIFE